MRCIAEYLQEQYNTVYHVTFASFLLDVPGTFSNATHQVKAIAIGVSEANPLVKSIDCSTPLHSTRILVEFYLKELTPNTHFYIALYSKICAK